MVVQMELHLDSSSLQVWENLDEMMMQELTFLEEQVKDAFLSWTETTGDVKEEMMENLSDEEARG